MISSGPGQHHREHYKDNQEGRGSSPAAFSSGLSSRMIIISFEVGGLRVELEL